MGSGFSKAFSKEPEPNIKLSNKKTEIYYQVAIKSGGGNYTQNILKCLQVSDFVSRPVNYKVGSKPQVGGGFFNFMKSPKNLFIFCCEDTFEAKMTLFFSWIKFIDPKLPILIRKTAGQNRQNRQNFKNLKKIPLIFEEYKGNTDASILDYYIQTYKINLANYAGIYLVFVQNFPDKKECELLDSSQNPLFPGDWVNSEFVKNGIFKGSNPLLDGLFLPDLDELSLENDLDKLRKIDGYLRFLMMHYSGNLGKIKNFKNVKLPDNYFFSYQNMRKILIEKIKNLKKTQQNPV
jgi:hypothetical protein